jgi:hypothetical protein
MASCGSDDFGLTAERRSFIDSKWAQASSIEQEAMCESLQTTDGKLELWNTFEEELAPDVIGADDLESGKDLANKINEDYSDEAEAARGETAEAMVDYTKAKC